MNHKAVRDLFWAITSDSVLSAAATPINATAAHGPLPSYASLVAQSTPWFAELDANPKPLLSWLAERPRLTRSSVYFLSLVEFWLTFCPVFVTDEQHRVLHVAVEKKRLYMKRLSRAAKGSELRKRLMNSHTEAHQELLFALRQRLLVGPKLVSNQIDASSKTNRSKAHQVVVGELRFVLRPKTSPYLLHFEPSLKWPLLLDISEGTSAKSKPALSATDVEEAEKRLMHAVNGKTKTNHTRESFLPHYYMYPTLYDTYRATVWAPPTADSTGGGMGERPGAAKHEREHTLSPPHWNTTQA